MPPRALATAIGRCRYLARKQQWRQIQNVPLPAKDPVSRSIIQASPDGSSSISWRCAKFRFTRGFSSSSDQNNNGGEDDNPHSSVTGSIHGEVDSDTPSESKIPGLSTEEKEKRASELGKALPEVSLQRNDEFDEQEKGQGREEEHKLMAVGTIGAPNAVESTLTNDTVARAFLASWELKCTREHSVAQQLHLGASLQQFHPFNSLSKVA